MNNEMRLSFFKKTELKIVDLKNINLYTYIICGGGQSTFEWVEHRTSEVEDNTSEIIWGTQRIE